MVKIPLGTSIHQRSIAKQPEIRLLNRFFEMNPTNLVDQVSLLVRPYIAALDNIGYWPITNSFSQDGTLDGDAFMLSDNDMYR